MNRKIKCFNVFSLSLLSLLLFFSGLATANRGREIMEIQDKMVLINAHGEKNERLLIDWGILAPVDSLERYIILLQQR